MIGVEFGTLPDWLEAVGTIAAVIVALWLATSERRFRELTEARAAAKLLSVNSGSQGTSELDESGRITNRRRAHTMSVGNGSERAFFDIKVVLDDPAFNMPVIDRLAPASAVTHEVASTDDSVRTLPRYQVCFRDERGHRWLRDREYVVRRVLPRRLWRLKQRLD